MPTSLHAQVLVDLFKSNGLNARPSISLDEEIQADVLVWPYAADLDPAQRNASLPSRGERPAPVEPHPRTHVLVIPSSLVAYDRARTIVWAHPYAVPPDGHAIRISIVDMTPQDMAALFLAANAGLRLALPLVIQESQPP